MFLWAFMIDGCSVLSRTWAFMTPTLCAQFDQDDKFNSPTIPVFIVLLPNSGLNIRKNLKNSTMSKRYENSASSTVCTDIHHTEWMLWVLFYDKLKKKRIVIW